MKANYATAPGGVSAGRLKPLADFGSNPGSLQAGCYLPPGFAAGRPLVVVLHGCTQTASAYDRHSGWSELADECGFALLYPEQQRGNNPNLCFNWFQPQDTQRQSGEALSIRQMIEAMVAKHGIDRGRIFITGLSAGGAMTASMLAAYPDVFAGGAIIAGLAHGVAQTVPEAFDRMRGHGLPSQGDLQRKLNAASNHDGKWPRISIWHGSADQTVAFANAENIVGQWRHVHRLEGRPTLTTVDGALTRQVWCDPAGTPTLEINAIAGMGHGTPLGPDLGTPGPFMLDAGISSTREIARFWGIATSAANSPAADDGFAQRASVEPHVHKLPAVVESDPIHEEAATASPRPAAPVSGIQKTIEDALRAAGLMR